MRLFVAIPLPDSITDKLHAVQGQIKRVGCNMNYAKDFHLTLLFLGDCDGHGQIIHALSSLTFSPFKLSLSDIGIFPNWQNPKVVWVGLIAPDELFTLQRSIETALNHPPDKPFNPHLTVGRVKYIKNKRNFKDILANTKVQKKSFVVNEFQLIESTLTPEGPVYHILKTFKA